MKTLFSLVVGLLFAFTSPAAFGQEIPKGQWVAMPRFDGTNVDLVSVDWDSADAMVRFNGNSVSNIMLHVANDSEGIRYDWPGGNHDVVITNVASWKQFALRVQGGFALIGEGMYVETEPFTVLGLSTTLRSMEKHSFELVFQNTNRIQVVRTENWLGNIPKTGDKVYLGRQGSGEQNFFPVRKSEGEFLLAPTTYQALAQNEKNAAEEKKEWETKEKEKRKGQ